MEYDIYVFNETTRSLATTYQTGGSGLQVKPTTISSPEYMSYIFGALYLTMWSLSFYPQIWENYKRQNSYGLAFEFVYL